jgi:hypothetical protein
MTRLPASSHLADGEERGGIVAFLIRRNTTDNLLPPLVRDPGVMITHLIGAPASAAGALRVCYTTPEGVS